MMVFHTLRGTFKLYQRQTHVLGSLAMLASISRGKHLKVCHTPLNKLIYFHFLLLLDDAYLEYYSITISSSIVTCTHEWNQTLISVSMHTLITIASMHIIMTRIGNACRATSVVNVRSIILLRAEDGS